MNYTRQVTTIIYHKKNIIKKNTKIMSYIIKIK